jgi:hypothetical protein
MSEIMIFTPILSASFDRARKLSRVMAVIFTICFWLTLAGSVLILSIPFAPLISPGHAMVGLNDISVSLDGLSLAQRVLVLLAIEMTALPVVFLMHHTRQVFGHFARGEVFVLPVIVHVRRAGLWLIVSFFANIVGQLALKALGLIPPGQVHSTSWPLIIGIVTTIGAYVMEEARRFAADSAEIV